MGRKLRNVARSGDEALVLVRQLSERCTVRPAPNALRTMPMKGERELLKPLDGFIAEPKPWQRKFRGVLQDREATVDLVRMANTWPLNN